MVEQPGIEFREESDLPDSKESSIKEIILRQIKKIGDLCSKEFTGGYWQEKPIKTGTGILFTKEYHEDVREAYCVAVEFIVDLVYSKADNKLKDIIDEEEKTEYIDIKLKLKSRRKLFRELNTFFDRDDYFTSSDSSDE